MNNRRSFIVGIKSTKLSNKVKKFLKTFKPWGVILFTRNIKNIKHIKILKRKIKNQKYQNITEIVSPRPPKCNC